MAGAKNDKSGTDKNAPSEATPKADVDSGSSLYTIRYEGNLRVKEFDVSKIKLRVSLK